MTIQIDSREQKFDHIKSQLDRMGVKHFVSKLPVGDYISLDNARLAIDRKRNLQELCGNLCQQHDRFRRELERARDLGIHLVFLVEHSRSIRTLSDVRHWQNPRLSVSPYALNGPALYQRLVTIENRYGTTFHFCDKSKTGEMIVELLENNGRPYQITIVKGEKS